MLSVCRALLKTRTPLSATVGLALAGWKGATHIDVYGADMQGLTDWDGTTLPNQKRKEERWIRERAIWAGTVERLKDMGCTVTRIGYDDA